MKKISPLVGRMPRGRSCERRASMKVLELLGFWLSCAWGSKSPFRGSNGAA